MRSLRLFGVFVGFALTIAAAVASEADAIKNVTAAGGKLRYDKVGKKRVVGGVTLKGEKATDAVLKDVLEFPELSRFELRDGSKATAVGVADLAKLKKLATVELQGPVVSDDSARALGGSNAIVDLKLVDGDLTDAGVKELAGMSKLQTLALTQNKKIRGTTIPALVAVKDLNSLAVTGCTLGDLKGWAALKKLTKLSILSLSRAEVTDAGLKELGQLTQITFLSLDNSPITDAGLVELKKLKALATLNLVNTKITEKAVPILSEMKQLTYLNVSEKQIGKDGIEALKKALPKCDVDVAK